MRQMTQTEKIVRHMQDYGEITTMEAIQEYGIMRLASRISDLKREGVPITRRMVKGINRYGEPVCYAAYSLEKDGIAG